MGTQPTEITWILFLFLTELNQFLVINVPGHFGGRETNISFTVVMKVKLDFQFLKLHQLC